MKHYLYALLVISMVVAVTPGIAYGANFVMSPRSGNFSVGKSFTVNILLSSPTQEANAFSASLTFPHDILQISSISKAGSITSLWVQEPVFSNVNGTLRFEGAILNPGYQGSGGKLLSVTFKAVGGGAPLVAINSGSILANDGEGTNIISALTSAQYDITQGAIVVTPTPASSPAGNTTSTLDIGLTSPTHPTPESWSKSSVATFQWRTPEGASGVQYGIDTNPTATPSAALSDAIPSVSIPLDIYSQDGVYYFHIRFQKGTEWTKVYHRKILIDRVPPEVLEVSEVKQQDETDPRPELRIDAQDSGSGVAYVELHWNGGKQRISVEEARRLRMPAIQSGAQDIRVTAVDGAGNERSTQVHVYSKPLPTPEIQGYTQQVGPLFPWSDEEQGVASIHGSAGAGYDVLLAFTGPQGKHAETIARADTQGRWEAAYPVLSRGQWTVRVTARDARGATSMPSDPITIRSGEVMPRLVWLLPWPIVLLLTGLLIMVYRRRKRDDGIEVPITVIGGVQ